MRNILLILFLALPFFGFVSDNSVPKNEKFRRDYSLYTVYDVEADTWTEWKSGNNTFIFNYNSRNDVMHMRGDGKNIIYKKISSITEGKTDEGEEYQLFDAIDEDGKHFTLQLYSNREMGMKMIYSDIYFQFGN